MNTLAEGAQRHPSSASLLKEFLPKILDVMGIHSGAAYILHPNLTLSLLTQRGYPAQVELDLEHLLEGSSLVQRVIHGREPIWISQNDSLEEEIKVLRCAGARSLIFAPIQVGGEVLGVLLLSSQEREPQWDLIYHAGLWGIQIGQTKSLYRLAAQSSAADLRYHKFMDQAFDGICVLTVGGTFLEVNRQFEKLTGYDQSELMGMKYLDTVDPATLEDTAQQFTELLNRGSIIAKDIRLLRKDGSAVYVDIAATIIELEHPVVFSIARDVTDRRSVQATLRERAVTAALLSDVLTALGQRTSLHAALGQCAEAIVRHRDLALAQIWLHNETANVLELKAGSSPVTTENGIGTAVPVGRLEVGKVARDRAASVIQSRKGHFKGSGEEGLASFAGYPLLQDGKLIGVLSVFSRDVLSPATLSALESIASTLVIGIDRRVSEKALVESESRFRELGTHATVGIFAANSAGDVTYVNPRAASLFGRDAKDLLGRGWSLGIHPEDRDRVGQAWSACIRENKDFAAVARILTPVGEVRWVDGKWSVARASDGKIVSIVGTIVDLTEQKRVENLKDEFVSVVSHELRTPLTSIRGALGLMAGGVTGALPDKALAMVRIASQNCERQIRLINDILDINKLETGKMVFDICPIRIGSMVQNSIDANRAYAQGFGVDLALDDSAPQAVVRADGDRLMSVMANLISNAVKFSPKGGRVTLGIARHSGMIRTTVTDRGSGIPEQFRPRIFQKFAQADSTDSRSRQGTGLGLSITKSIIEKLGGRIGFESVIGSGTTFFFDLTEEPAVGAESPL